MLCKIAELLAEVPEAGGLAPRCKEYLWNGEGFADILIREDLYRSENYPNFSENDMAYMESARLFYGALLNFEGFYLHASAVAVDGKAYLFSANSGVGKSTHTRLWQSLCPDAQVFNDDKPALRCLDGKWFAYGTPWCGKDGININMKAPVAGICFLKQADNNQIRRLSPVEAVSRILPQTIHHFKNAEKLDVLLSLVDKLVRQIPVYELENRPEPEAAWLSYETMRRGAEEMRL